MDMPDILSFIQGRQRGVLATQRASGRPQLSNIIYGVEDRFIRISVTDDRAKTRNMRRDPRASLHVTADDFWSWAVVDCEATLSEVARQPGDAAIESLRSLYRTVNGEHPDWDDFDRAMIQDKRLVATLRPTHGYGQGIRSSSAAPSDRSET